MAGKQTLTSGEDQDVLQKQADRPRALFMDFDTASTSSLLSESVNFYTGNRECLNSKTEEADNMDEHQNANEAERSVNTSPEQSRVYRHRGTFSEMFRPTATPTTTHGFYETLEAENPCRGNGLTSSYERQQKRMTPPKIPSWAWVVLVNVLGVRHTPAQKLSYLSIFLHALTILLACTFTVTGVIHTVFDIRSKFSNTTLLTGCVNLLIGFCWICLGLYSRRLAARLFSNRNLSESVRIHSRTFFKISAAGLLILFSVALASLDMYSTYTAFGPKHCDKIFLHTSVCHVMYYSHVAFTVIGLIWNILVGCVLLSVCRTHTIGIRKFIQDLEDDAKICEAVCKENILKFRRPSIDIDIVHSHGSWFIWDDSTERRRPESSDGDSTGHYHPLNNEGSANSSTADLIVQNQGPGQNTQSRNGVVDAADIESVKSDRPPILTDDEILMSYWKISNRMRVTSKQLQRWLASWIAFILIWCVDYVILWINKTATVIDIFQFVLPVILLMIVTSAFAEANGEGQRMIRCICPTRDRLTILFFLNQQPLQMKVFNTSITYNAILGVILAFSVAFVSRIILDEVFISK